MSNIFDINSTSFDPIDEESELIPLMTSDDEEAISREKLPESLPILPLRNTVLFPGVVIPITASRDKSVKLIKNANSGDKLIGVVSQKDSSVSDPKISDINKIGTVAKILRVLQMPDGNITVIIQGKKRFEVKDIISDDPYFTATINEMPESKPDSTDKKFIATIDSIKDLALKIINENSNIPSEASFAIKNIHSNAFLVNFVSSNMNISANEKYNILKINGLQDRALSCLKFMNVEFQKLSLKNDIQSKVRTDLDQQQREYFLNQQLKTIQEELGTSSNDQEIEEMRVKSKTKNWNDKIADHFNKELAKLKRMNSQASEYSIQRNYIELILDLPWNKYSGDNFNIKRANKILDRDHYGLKDVKDRILEQIAVLKLKKNMNSPILCFYGPPGVGKTSLGKSISEALGREYVRISLGGLRDEAELRGHRKTYIGAMPGRIIQNLKKVKTSNPVFILDEIDKLSVGSQGDPSSALLEILDPEQNNEFYDNFLELGYDLSKILFIATANNLNTIQPALIDRMELINLSGYSLEEKINIAKKHLISKQLKANGLEDFPFKLDGNSLKKIIQGYTRESGVRNLEKCIAKICRSYAKQIVENNLEEINSEKLNIEKVLGVPVTKQDAEKNNLPGISTGLAWTQYGGEILYIESIISKGKGGLTITGNLGKVMKESATIALEFIKSNCATFGINSDIFNKYNIHLHVPEGATPKDGPSAGITILTSLISLLTQRKVKNNFAMSGEITLRGKVLPVGGIKEKVLAAKRANVKEIILSSDNQKHVNDIDSKYLKGLKFHYVSEMKDVIGIAIMKNKISNSIEF